MNRSDRLRPALFLALTLALTGSFLAAQKAAPPAPVLPAAHRAVGTPAQDAPAESSSEAVWSELLAGNQRFMEGRATEREVAERRSELAQGQHPRAIVLSCSDSRVPPELVFDQGLGELFVVRTAGNVADLVALGSIEYALEHLHVTTLVVLGHEKCGAVAAAASGDKMPTRNLDAIVARIVPALDGVRAEAPSKELLAQAGIPANVRRSARDLISNSPVVKEEVLEGRLTIVRALYHLESGEVERLW